MEGRGRPHEAGPFKQLTLGKHVARGDGVAIRSGSTPSEYEECDVERHRPWLPVGIEANAIRARSRSLLENVEGLSGSDAHALGERRPFGVA